MTVPLTPSQALTREAVVAARPLEGRFLRDEGAFEVLVECACCRADVHTWVTPGMQEAPFVLCSFCERDED